MNGLKVLVTAADLVGRLDDVIADLDRDGANAYGVMHGRLIRECRSAIEAYERVLQDNADVFIRAANNLEGASCSPDGPQGGPCRNTYETGTRTGYRCLVHRFVPLMLERALSSSSTTSLEPSAQKKSQ